jgi:hypothetical protein
MSVDPGTGTYGSWTAYSASRAFTLAGGDGTKTVRVQYVDTAGNVATLTDTIVLSTGVPDTTAPRTTSDAKATYEAPATILLTPTDEAGGSGVAHTYYKLDGGAQSEGLTVTTSSLGAHTLEFWSVDNASNAETPHNTAAFTVFAPGSGPRTFSFTGGDQTYTVADGVTAVDVDLYGGAGGGIDGIGGGLGGHVHATIPVTVGQVLTLKVGGAGAGDGGTAGGWPTGGAGDGSHGAAGGGSSSILLGTTILAEAGGGGGADHADGPGGDGGAQGWLPGGGQTGDNQGGAGGGGGWNGGAAYPAHEGGGDGGTSYIAVGTGTLTAGVQNGDGSIVVTPVRGGNSRTFAATGADQSFTVPDGVSAITVDLKGAQGGNGGGLGGVVHATIPVTAGELLTVRVGDTAGWPNGGAGTDSGGAGGGSSSVLLGTAVLAEAGGGGGFAGGGEPGGAGGASLASDPGGNDFGADGYMYGAGGGGGWNGGDSPGDDTSGSGGTSRIAVGTGTMTAGAWEGDGSVVISW